METQTEKMNEGFYNKLTISQREQDLADETEDEE